MNLKQELKSIGIEPDKGKYEIIIEKLIESAKQGIEKATFSKSFYDKNIINSLRAEGLIVEEIEDFRDGDYIKVSW